MSATSSQRRRSAETARTVAIRSEHPEGAWAVRVLRRLAPTVTAEAPEGELAVTVVDDAEIRRLNRTFRRKNKATDVLSFPQQHPGLLGDVVISLDTARRQAAERRQPLSDELARLLAHGVLHLCGHDHETPAEAAEMARAEARLLGRLGMVGEALAAEGARAVPLRPDNQEFRRLRRGAGAGARK